METGQIVGLVLLVAGLLDAVAARFLVGPRARDARQRLLIEGSLLASAAVMVLLGGVLLAGLLRFE